MQLEPKSTALVLIDLQNGIVARTTLPYSAADVVEKGARLAQAFRSAGALVVYVRLDFANMVRVPADVSSFDPSAPPAPASASELTPDSGVRPEDLIVTKRYWGAFIGTPLEAELRARGIDTIVLGGIATNIGVESTAREAAGLGFAVVLAEDACTTFDEASQKFAFEKIFPRLGRVRTTQQVVDAIG